MVLTVKCKNCEGPLIFNPDKQNWKCEYCLSEFDSSELSTTNEETTEAEQNSDQDADIKIYHCNSCGAELIITDTEAANWCAYCHNPVIYIENMTDSMKPKYIIPFTKTKEDTINSISNWVKSKKYIPKNFYNKKNIDKICGIYFPYWITDQYIYGSFIGEGTNSYTEETPDYIITRTQHFRVVREANIMLYNIPRASLKKIDKKLSEAIFPYNFRETQKFEYALLSGYQAERKNIEINDIKDNVETEAKSYVKSLLLSNAHYDTINGSTKSDIKGSNYKYYLLPAWVMTYKDSNGQYYYYEMNGQTGEVVGILPVNQVKLTIDGLLLGLIGFIITLTIGFLIV